MNPMRQIVVIAHNIRSTHNIGAIFRTAEGFGISKIILSGYSPYPGTNGDTRLPHIREKLTRDIHKTALGAEQMVPYEHSDNVAQSIKQLKTDGFRIVALEQAKNSVALPVYAAREKTALLLGEEVHGIETELIQLCDDIIEIPMLGQKESFNVSVATGIALYHLRHQ